MLNFKIKINNNLCIVILKQASTGIRSRQFRRTSLGPCEWTLPEVRDLATRWRRTRIMAITYLIETLNLRLPSTRPMLLYAGLPMEDGRSNWEYGIQLLTRLGGHSPLCGSVVQCLCWLCHRCSCLWIRLVLFAKLGRQLQFLPSQKHLLWAPSDHL